MSEHSRAATRSNCKSLLRAAVAGAALWLALSPAQTMAVTITTDAIINEASIVNNGNVLYAVTYSGGAPTTVNGISFNTTPTGGLGVAFSGFGGCGGDFSNHFTAGSGLDRILSGCAFQPGGSSSLTLSNLVVGDEYTVQLLWANTLNTTGRNSRISTGGTTVNFAFNSATPRNIKTVFTATGASQLFSFGTGSAIESRRFQLNAAVVSGPIPVPVPPTAALLAMGLLIPVFGRWKRSRAG